MVQMICSKMKTIVFALVLTTIGLLPIVSSSGSDLSDLKARIYAYEDPKITVDDLAFYLLTHNYDARPMDGYVRLDLNKTLYRLVPNGDKPGLYDILPDNTSNA